MYVCMHVSTHACMRVRVRVCVHTARAARPAKPGPISAHDAFARPLYVHTSSPVANGRSSRRAPCDGIGSVAEAPEWGTDSRNGGVRIFGIAGTDIRNSGYG